MEIVAEFDCFCRAFLSLEKVKTKEELFIPPSAEIQTMLDALDAQMKDMVEKMDEKTNLKMGADQTAAESGASEDRPRLLIMAGSGTGVLQVCNLSCKLTGCNATLKLTGYVSIKLLDLGLSSAPTE